MNEELNKKIASIADIIVGEVIRMCLTDNVDELCDMCSSANHNIDKLYRLVLDEKMKKED